MIFPYDLGNGLIIMKIEDPRWTNREKTRIDFDATFFRPDTLEQLKAPYTSCPNDPVDYCRALYAEALSMGPGEWRRPDVTVEDLQMELDKLMPDVVLGLASPEEIDLARTLRNQIKAMS
ncbi:tail fiber protein [Pseudomonas phage vB_PpuP-Kallioja]